MNQNTRGGAAWLDSKYNESEASEAETTELQELLAAAAADGRPDWEDVFHRADRSIANWCIANPDLVDRKGHPVAERGIRDVKAMIEAQGREWARLMLDDTWRCGRRSRSG